MEQVKEAYNEERAKLQQQSDMLQGEVEELQKELENNKISRKKVDEMTKTINSLQREKKLVS